MSIEQTLRRYVLETFLFSDDDSLLKNEDSFLEQGIIDSTGIMELILFLEETFGVTTTDDELVPENLDSIDSLVAFIGRKQAAAAG